MVEEKKNVNEKSIFLILLVSLLSTSFDLACVIRHSEITIRLFESFNYPYTQANSFGRLKWCNC